MLRNKSPSIRMIKTKLFWKLTITNILVIGVVIWIAGISVKDFACNLANQMSIVGEQRQSFFNSTLDYYLLRASIIAFIIATFIHYVIIKRITVPIKDLFEATKKMYAGEKITPIPVRTNDEIGQLTRQFNELVNKIRQSEDLREKMTVDLAHEVRTPLANLTGYLEALKNGVIEPEKELLKSLHGEAIRLKTLIEYLYTLSEMEWENYLNDEKPANSKKVMEQVVSIYSMELKNKHIPIQIGVEEAEIDVSTNLFKQVLGNILQNAIQYAVEDTKLKVIGKKENQIFQLSISGKGKLIPLNDKNRVFERFFRGDQSRNHQSGGSGLGLAIVKELVESQGGKVWLDTNGTYHQFILQFNLSK